MSGEGLNLQLIGKGRLADVFACEDNKVVKLFAAGRDAATIAAEAQVSQIVHDAGVATPAAYGVIEIDGRQGIILDRVAGVSMLALLTARPWKILELGRMLAELHVSIHQNTAGGLPSQRAHLEQLITRAKIPDAQRDLALARLGNLPDGTAICHGDYHPDNVLIDGVRLDQDRATIIDWSTACIGNPVADFVLTSLLLQLGAPSPGMGLPTRIAMRVGRALFYRTYAGRYRRLSNLSPQDVQPWLLPVAVARLGDDVTAERDQLIALINQAIDTSAA